MKTTDVSRAALGRIPVYLRFLESLPQDTETVSATVIAKELGFGEDTDFWGLCGLLHDVDFEKWPEQHCVKAPELLLQQFDELLTTGTTRCLIQ